MDEALIQTIILSISALLIVALVLRHLSKLAELDDEGKTRREEERTSRALGVVRAELTSQRTEIAALNNGFGDAGFSPEGSGDINTIMSLIQNPAVMGLLKNLKGTGQNPPNPPL